MGAPRPGARFRKIAREFFRTADHDLTVAADLAGKGWYSDAVMYAQQAVEKAIKGALELTRVAIRGHELGVAFTEHVVNASDHAAWHERLAALRPLIDQFDGLWTDTRYPRWDVLHGRAVSPMQRYGEDDAHLAMERASHIVSTLKAFSKDVYRVSI